LDRDRQLTLSIDPKSEARLREKAEAEGLTVSAYVERMVRADLAAEEELESFAVEGIDSGAPIEAGPGYWEEKHRRLDERLIRRQKIEQRRKAFPPCTSSDSPSGRGSGVMPLRGRSLWSLKAPAPAAQV
jgi:hypothetical protein